MKKLQTASNDDEESVERTVTVIRRLIERFEEQLDTTQAKGSIGDYIKLLQLEQDLQNQRVKRIEVKWVDTD